MNKIVEKNEFNCHLCEKNFKYKNSLSQHLKIHAGLVEACTVCFIYYLSMYLHNDLSMYLYNDLYMHISIYLSMF